MKPLFLKLVRTHVCLMRVYLCVCAREVSIWCLLITPHRAFLIQGLWAPQAA